MSIVDLQSHTITRCGLQGISTTGLSRNRPPVIQTRELQMITDVSGEPSDATIQSVGYDLLALPVSSLAKRNYVHAAPRACRLQRWVS